MKDDDKKPPPLHERLSGESVSNKNEDKPEQVDDVITGGQAGSPHYKNMNNETKEDPKKED